MMPFCHLPDCLFVVLMPAYYGSRGPYQKRKRAYPMETGDSGSGLLQGGFAVLSGAFIGLGIPACARTNFIESFMNLWY